MAKIQKQKTPTTPAPPPTIDDIIQRYRDWQIGRPPLPTPTRVFKIGQEVRFGGHKNIHVVDSIDGGLSYLLHYDYIDNNSQVKHKHGHTCARWIDVFAINENESACFAEKDDLRITFTNSDIDSLLSKVYSFGVDFDPPYQRGLVWGDGQKTALIDSVFANIDIGKFTFNRLEYGKADPHKLYQIIDGKQRLTTLCKFYEGRFAYRGKLYHELSWYDRHHFERFPIVQAEMREATEQQILKLFVKLNTSGIPMSALHLEKVKAMIDSY